MSDVLNLSTDNKRTTNYPKPTRPAHEGYFKFKDTEHAATMAMIKALACTEEVLKVHTKYCPGCVVCEVLRCSGSTLALIYRALKNHPSIR